MPLFVRRRIDLRRDPEWRARGSCGRSRRPSDQGLIVTWRSDNGQMEFVPKSEVHGGLTLSGRMLRYVCTTLIFENGPCSVPQLYDLIRNEGFTINGRPSKTISDALRWEIAHDRVERLGRSLYGPGVLPRTTRDRITRRVSQLRVPARHHQCQQVS